MTAARIDQIARKINALSRRLHGQRRRSDTRPRCWECNARMSEASRNLSPFCSHACELAYNRGDEFEGRA